MHIHCIAQALQHLWAGGASSGRKWVNGRSVRSYLTVPSLKILIPCLARRIPFSGSGSCHEERPSTPFNDSGPSRPDSPASEIELLISICISATALVSSPHLGHLPSGNVASGADPLHLCMAAALAFEGEALLTAALADPSLDLHIDDPGGAASGMLLPPPEPTALAPISRGKRTWGGRISRRSDFSGRPSGHRCVGARA